LKQLKHVIVEACCR